MTGEPKSRHPERRCPMSDLRETQCAHCTGATLPEEGTQQARRWSLTAKFPSDCTGCPERIEVGDAIVRTGTSYGHGEWAHLGCA